MVLAHVSMSLVISGAGGGFGCAHVQPCGLVPVCYCTGSAGRGDRISKYLCATVQDQLVGVTGLASTCVLLYRGVKRLACVAASWLGWGTIIKGTAGGTDRIKRCPVLYRPAVLI